MSIGHSTRPAKEFIRLLKAHQVKRLVECTHPRVRGTIRSSTEANYRPPRMTTAIQSRIARITAIEIPHLIALARKWIANCKPIDCVAVSHVLRVKCVGTNIERSRDDE